MIEPYATPAAIVLLIAPVIAAIFPTLQDRHFYTEPQDATLTYLLHSDAPARSPRRSTHPR